jgi:histidine ammonia-lyase
MGANAAVKSHSVVNNLYDILAIELLTACQALEFRRPLKSSPVVEKVFEAFRQEIPFMAEDRVLSVDIHQAARFIRNHAFAD